MPSVPAAPAPPGAVRVLPCGDTALLVELADLPATLALHADLRAHPLPGVVDLVPAARTVLVRAGAGADLTRLAAALRDRAARAGAGGTGHDGPLVELPVVYDGADLAEVGELTGLGARGVVAAHTGSVWTTAFTGFAPGFAYLTGGDPRLQVPRRPSPRTRVPAGSVGLAGLFSGVYPRASPGGWQLIGRCGTVLFDVERDPPALLRPGTRVRFVEVAGEHRP